MPATAIIDKRDAARATDTSRATTETAIAISVANLSKTYPVPLARLKQFFRRKSTTPVEALRDVSFAIREGEIFGLIGRNGAGKTTLTKIIATLVQPTSGTVTVRGYDSVRDEERVRAQIGLAGAEERTFYWRLTVEQNLKFFARLYGLTDRATRRRITELLAHFELTDQARRRFGELSTGNKQRMAVARALLNDHPVLLLDEPTRSLDPLAASRMRSLIASLARQDPPVTILLTSHNLAEVEELCERVAIISQGQIRAIDTPENLRSLHKQTERVHLTIRGISGERATQLLSSEFAELKTVEQDGIVTVSFQREAADNLLDEAMRALLKAGAHVLACDAERGTLLDVLESYEREDVAERRESP